VEGSSIGFKRKLRIMILNVQSIMSGHKSQHIATLCINEHIDIALLQETHATEMDKIFIKGYKIIRSDSNLRKNGIAILIAQNLPYSITKLQSKSQDGYVLTIELGNKRVNQEFTITSIYLPPSYTGSIPTDLLLADIVGGDINQHPISIDREGVYGFKGLNKVETVAVPKSLTDHKAVICETKEIYVGQDSSIELQMIDRSKAQHNLLMIEKILTTEEPNGEMIPPIVRKKMNRTLTSIIDPYDIEIWADIKEAEINLKGISKEEKKRIAENTLAGRTVNGWKWEMLGDYIGASKHLTFYNPDENITDILKGFRDLYKHSETQDLTCDEIIKTIWRILEDLEGKTGNKIFKPRSEAADAMGFRQRDIYDLLDNTSLKNQIKSFKNLMMKLEVRKDKHIFIHNITKMILANKKLNPKSWVDYRPISIIPCFLIILEKLYIQAFADEIQSTLSKHQFGFKKGHSCSMAKSNLY